MYLPTRYESLDTKGEGGFGRVVRVRDKWLERDIAVKILDPIMALREPERKRFHQEARVLAKMSHPAIPAIYDVFFKDPEAVGDEPPHFQIIFEHIAGRTLHRYLQDEGPANVDLARQWFTQLASALSHAHSLGIVHRDVKPKNIIIRTGDEDCCLVDFGIALTDDQAERVTGKGHAIGTPGYMSPEQMAGQTVDHETDVYSLGVCLYEALAGSPVPQGEYKPLATINEVIPPAIDELVQDCMKPHGERIADATAFASRLTGALRTRQPLSKVLSEGRLSDLDTTLLGMTASEFADRPAGQRRLIIQKVLHLSESEESRLEFPASSLLDRLIHLGTHLAVDEYGEIIERSLYWAFERKFANGQYGEQKLRRTIARESPQLPRANHAMVAEKVLKYFADNDPTSYDEWRLRGVREIANNLMANRACEDEEVAAKLESLLRRVRLCSPKRR